MQPHGEGPDGRNVDFGRTAEDYGRWRQGCPIDAAHAVLLAESFPEEPVAVPHRVHCVLGRR